ncbi:hypothetical protein VN24_14635 [Paenibacillus beijingensis]|uniref:Uncharacterized protein n=1 Tax=Paenibacillus beijingensis TaxID=1126833 RepID=A0A0D5NKN5_9BACL|nr:hypothetical protein VN24_14635 [Paenibacillus beijingensis]
MLLMDRKANFNPRIHEGCDVVDLDNYYYAHAFQSTHPRGMRLAVPLFKPEGVDISIHASARDATTFGDTSKILA